MNTRESTKLDFAVDLEFDEILTNPILDIAARFWEEDRYEAFKVCYRSMRRIDDLVDNRKETGKAISASEAANLTRMIYAWLKSVQAGERTDSFQTEFLERLEKFAIPLWPWERLCQAMVHDLKCEGYQSLRSFLRYAKGAAVAPAAVFMHLCGVVRRDGRYAEPAYDIRRVARPLALFSYFVHIIRDFRKDLKSNLNYFAHDLLRQHSLELGDLREIATGGEIRPSFRNLVGQYRSFADYYRRSARNKIDEMAGLLLPRYQLSLEVVYSLYSQVFERIDPAHGMFSQGELNPQPEEIKARLQLTVDRFAAAKN